MSINQTEIKIYPQEKIFIHSLLWLLVENTTDYIINHGIYLTFEKAVGEGFRIACDDEWCETVSPLYRLETDSGWGFDVLQNGVKKASFYILEAGNEGDIVSDQ